MVRESGEPGERAADEGDGLGGQESGDALETT